jgi:adenylate cyclase
MGTQESQSMSKKSRTIVLGVSTVLLGIVMSLIPFTYGLEEKIGLDLLFKLRGERQPPEDVIVVTISEKSARKLNVPFNLKKWPRSLHAQLIEKIVNKGASVIAFDIFFNEAYDDDGDKLFARALRDAGNVVLFQKLKKERDPFDEKGNPIGYLNIDRLHLPIPLFTQSTLALAPFALPKVPVRVSHYWTFKKNAGDRPTLPVVAFQIYALSVYKKFIQLLKKVSHSDVHTLLQSKSEIIERKNIVEIIQAIRYIFKKEPHIAEKMLQELENEEKGYRDKKKTLLLKSLIRMYESSDKQFLNFYGGPRSVTTIPYHQVLELPKDGLHKSGPPDFNGKAVFVGVSENLELGQIDGFYTVYTPKETGVDICGTEIAATAFANFLEDMPVKPLSHYWQLAIIVLWGMIIVILCYYFPSSLSLVIMVGVCGLYLIGALHYFKASGIWYPLVVPLFFQAPFAYLGALAWKYSVAHKERQNIKKAFSYYVPDEIIDKLSKDFSHIETSNKLVYGTCLYTDAEHFTTLSESMDPESLARVINQYFEIIFNPVKLHNGVISNVIADSMLALWATVDNDPRARKKACLTALDIKRALYDYSKSYNPVRLYTRIALHSGHILLGNVGAIDHYEYRAVGDIVNTVTRIEGLNKFLGTQILLSKEIVSELDMFLTRDVGEFLFVGKAKPLVIHELMCPIDECSSQQKDLCTAFNRALDIFRKQDWEKAGTLFKKIIENYGPDGPSSFYIQLCGKYSNNPPEETWSGVIRLDKK